MTREEFNSVTSIFDPLRNPMALPVRPSNMWQNHRLLAADSIRSTQDAWSNEYMNMARQIQSPLIVQEYGQGAITRTTA